ncbi:MAG: FxLYD domain-containing protein [Bifidobacteriaceae bacterium]|nr:FxLYD domain-containing protein [Bifidobacteriaceae bacterium]
MREDSAQQTEDMHEERDAQNAAVPAAHGTVTQGAADFSATDDVLHGADDANTEGHDDTDDDDDNDADDAGANDTADADYPAEELSEALRRSAQQSRDAHEASANVERSIRISGFVALALGLIGFAGAIVIPMSALSIVSVLALAVGAVFAFRAVLLEHYRNSWMRHRGGTAHSPHVLTVIGSATCVVAIIATVGLMSFTIVGNLSYMRRMRTWTLTSDGWDINGDIVRFQEDDDWSKDSVSVSSSATPTGTSGTSSGESSSSRATQAELTLFTGSNLTTKQVAHNNPVTDTDDSEALKIVDVTMDNRLFGYDNGWITVKNNTDQTVEYADLAFTMLTSNGDVAGQGVARCNDAIEPGETGRAYFQIGASAAASGLVIYTEIWYTPRTDEATTRTMGSRDEYVASRTAPGTVFHKSSPCVPGIPF